MAAGGWKVKLRLGPRVVRERADDLPGAIAELRIALVGLADEVQAKTVSALTRDFDPVQQVIGRGELRGPRREHGGVDVRGDGSTEAWTGRVRKAVVEQQDGEDAFQALERVLSP